MKGFIEVTRNSEPLLISLKAIARVSPYQQQTRIEFLVRDGSNSADKIFVTPSYTEVVKLIEAATK